LHFINRTDRTLSNSMMNIGHVLSTRWIDCDAWGSHNGAAVLRIQTLWNVTLLTGEAVWRHHDS